jgi:hypothetical protein
VTEIFVFKIQKWAWHSTWFPVTEPHLFLAGWAGFAKKSWICKFVYFSLLVSMFVCLSVSLSLCLFVCLCGGNDFAEEVFAGMKGRHCRAKSSPSAFYEIRKFMYLQGFKVVQLWSLQLAKANLAITVLRRQLWPISQYEFSWKQMFFFNFHCINCCILSKTQIFSPFSALDLKIVTSSPGPRQIPIYVHMKVIAYTYIQLGEVTQIAYICRTSYANCDGESLILACVTQ